MKRVNIERLDRSQQVSADTEAAPTKHEGLSVETDTSRATMFRDDVAITFRECEWQGDSASGYVDTANGCVTERTIVSDIRFIFGHPWPEFGALVFDINGSTCWEAMDEHGYLELARSHLYARFPTSQYDGHVAEIRQALRAWMSPLSLLEVWVDGWERLRVMVEFSASGRDIAQAIKESNARLNFEPLIEPGSAVSIFACGETPPALESAISLLNEETSNLRAVTLG